ncbi:hypothetical protein BaRGS_00029772 [Batillaria attramentaria]|uniref:Uncharacterized protein n=1 Tax=Batillaria attramentaria TaxID=370345 RepID=A0ABD0JWC2_9CAEN
MRLRAIQIGLRGMSKLAFLPLCIALVVLDQPLRLEVLFFSMVGFTILRSIVTRQLSLLLTDMAELSVTISRVQAVQITRLYADAALFAFVLPKPSPMPTPPPFPHPLPKQCAQSAFVCLQAAWVHASSAATLAVTVNYVIREPSLK